MFQNYHNYTYVVLKCFFSLVAPAPVSVIGCRESPPRSTVAHTRLPTNTSPISCVLIAALESSVTETQWPPLTVHISQQLFHPTLSPILQSKQVISL